NPCPACNRPKGPSRDAAYPPSGFVRSRRGSSWASAEVPSLRFDIHERRSPDAGPILQHGCSIPCSDIVSALTHAPGSRLQTTHPGRGSWVSGRWLHLSVCLRNSSLRRPGVFLKAVSTGVLAPPDIGTDSDKAPKDMREVGLIRQTAVECNGR